MTASQAHADAFNKDQPDLTNLPFEQLLNTEISTAARLAQKVSDAPSAVTVITAEDIKTYGYHTLADILNSIRGLYTTYDRSFQYLGGRGFGRPGDFTGRVLLMIDGYATNDNIYDQAYIDNSGLIDTELIDHVEFVPGPGSAVYGNNSFFGIVNIVTKQGRNFDGLQVAGDLISYGGKKGRATYGKRLENGADVLMSISYLDSDGHDKLFFPEFNDPANDLNFATNHGFARHLDYEDAPRVFGKLQFENWTLEGGYVSRKKGVPTGAYGVQFNAYNQYWDANAFLSAKYDTDLSPNLKTSVHAYYGYYLDRGAGIYPVTGMWREHNLGQWWGTDIKFVGTWFEGHKLVFGMEYRDDFQMDLENPFSKSSHQWTTTSLYAQDEISLTDRLQFNLGGRYDYNSAVNGHLSPRTALMYTPVDGTTIKLSYATAYRMPAAYEMFYTDGDSQLANLRLRPEHVATTELSVQHDFSQRMRLIGTLYHYNTRELITDVDVGGGFQQYTNIGHSHTNGAETEWDQAWDNGARLRTSIAYQEAIGQDGRHLINSPWWLAKLNLALPLLQHRAMGGFEMQYLGPRPTENGTTTGGYTVANLTLTSSSLLPGFDLSASIRNLFDKRYSVVAPAGDDPIYLLRMDGRNFWLQLSRDFR